MTSLTSVRPVFRCLTLAAVGLWLSAPAHANTATTYPTACAIAQYEMLSAYHELSNSPKEEKLRRNLEASNKVLSDCLRSISGQLGADSANRLTSANTGMNNDLAYNLGMIQKTGSSPGQPLASMVNHALETTRILTAQRSGKTPSADALRKLSVQMAYLKHRYLERIYALGGDANRDDSAEPAIENIVDDFSSSLGKLRSDKALASKGDVSTKLNAVHVRFNFLRKSILDYNNTSVPFVVTHHSAFIIKTLTEAASAAE